MTFILLTIRGRYYIFDGYTVDFKEEVKFLKETGWLEFSGISARQNMSQPAGA